MEGRRGRGEADCHATFVANLTKRVKSARRIERGGARGGGGGGGGGEAFALMERSPNRQTV